MTMRDLTRLAILLIGALFLAACGSTADTAADTLADTVDGIDEAVAVVDTDDVTEEQAPELEEEVPVAAETITAAPTTTVVEQVAPEPVTASTVPETTSDDFPDILAAQATPSDDGFWSFSVTVSSTYDTPQRYADAWRVVGPDGTELGIRVLAHDHANEQPFTRSQTIEIPADVEAVTIQGRDLANGWGGGTLELALN